MVVAIGRITSYNVCYTKLLRTLETQTQLGQACLGALETAAGRRTRKPGPGSPGPSALDPRDPIIPKDLPPLLRAQWMLGMLFAGWRLPAA